ncbi:hypothetical protein BDN71DRAFT_848652 [Pleurotus eryngii]|uniref:Uncharacterized protein n=1 Tax=Pleurotus eryngii TaxID=5323 RepID=A0A9P6A935_PLEER|nr:hypothetical protein BDN71DRAFT_848652 [Pleurotus eryngii]
MHRTPRRRCSKAIHGNRVKSRRSSNLLLEAFRSFPLIAADIYETCCVVMSHAVAHSECHATENTLPRLGSSNFLCLGAPPTDEWWSPNTRTLVANNSKQRQHCFSWHYRSTAVCFVPSLLVAYTSKSLGEPSLNQLPARFLPNEAFICIDNRLCQKQSVTLRMSAIRFPSSDIG